jgi:hypothetical protein
MKKTLFLVSSAINTSFDNSEQGIENEKIRIQETLSTVNSINSCYEDVEIWLLDSGKKEVDARYYDYFPSNFRFFHFWNDPYIKTISHESKEYASKMILERNISQDYRNQLEVCYIKSLTESYVFKTMINCNNFQDYNSVIKISGRYCLLPTHEKQNFLNHGKYTFSKAIRSNQPLCPVDYQYRTFLWGFCPSIQEDVKLVMNNTYDHLKESYDKLHVMDLEHSMFHNTKHKIENIYNTKSMGIYARMGNNNYTFFK